MTSKIVFMILYMLGTLGISIWSVIINYKQKIWEKVGIQLLLSRITAELFKWHLALILITVIYPIHTLLRHALRVNIFDGVRKFHSFLGKGMCIYAIIHSVSHIYTMKSVQLIDDSITFGYYYALFGSMWGWTGWVMNVILLVIVLSSTKYFRLRWYNNFFHIHHLYMLFIILILIHGSTSLVAVPTAGWYIGIPLVLFLLHKIYAIWVRHTSMYIMSTTIIEQRGDTAVLVYIKTNPIFRNMMCRPGATIWLNCSELSKIEWHPYAMLSNSDEYFSLLIHNRGDWSNNLCNLLKISKPILYIDGPYSSIADEYIYFDHIVFISGGIGTITLASILFDMQYHNYHIDTLYTYWIFKYKHQLQWIDQSIRNIHNIKYNELICERFITQDAASACSTPTVSSNMDELEDIDLDDVKELLRDDEIEVMDFKRNVVESPHEARRIEISSKEIQYRRPDIDIIFTNIIQRVEKNGIRIYGIFVCGPKLLMQDVDKACKTYSGNQKKIKFILKRVK